MKKIITTSIRFALSIVLLCFIYNETGLATTIFAFLVIVRAEVTDHLKRTGKDKSFDPYDRRLI